jgi:hypothetical protein
MRLQARNALLARNWTTDLVNLGSALPDYRNPENAVIGNAHLQICFLEIYC